MRKVIFIFFVLSIQISSYGQIDYTKQYFNGKSLFREGKYNLAMETFKPLLTSDRNNQYSEYATFYYALSAYNLGYKSLAKTNFNQIKTLHPAWDKMDDVNYWIGKINLEDKDYFQGLKILALVQDKNLLTSVEAMKAKSIGEITDAETLKLMHEDSSKILFSAFVRSFARAVASTLATTASFGYS